MSASYSDQVRLAIQHATEGRQPGANPDKPIMRIHFDDKPSATSFAMLEAFDHDSLFAFGQALRVTSGYGSRAGGFEVDYQLNDTGAEKLFSVASKVTESSGFDNLAEKYRIRSVRLFNFPGQSSTDLTVKFISPSSAAAKDAPSVA